MAAFKVRNLWNAFITAFFALLASVGLTTAAPAAAQPAVRTPDEPVKARPQAARGGVPAQRGRPSTRRLPTARDRSLPPTIKQRIGAEAHGSSPAPRHLPALEADATDIFAPAAADSAPAAAAADTGSKRAARAGRTALFAQPVHRVGTAVPAARAAYTTAA